MNRTNYLNNISIITNFNKSAGFTVECKNDLGYINLQVDTGAFRTSISYDKFLSLGGQVSSLKEEEGSMKGYDNIPSRRNTYTTGVIPEIVVQGDIKIRNLRVVVLDKKIKRETGLLGGDLLKLFDLHISNFKECRLEFEQATLIYGQLLSDDETDLYNNSFSSEYYDSNYFSKVAAHFNIKYENDMNTFFKKVYSTYKSQEYKSSIAAF